MLSGASMWLTAICGDMSGFDSEAEFGRVGSVGGDVDVDVDVDIGVGDVGLSPEPPALIAIRTSEFLLREMDWGHKRGDQHPPGKGIREGATMVSDPLPVLGKEPCGPLGRARLHIVAHCCTLPG